MVLASVSSDNKTYQTWMAERLLQIAGLQKSPQSAQVPKQLRTDWVAECPDGASLRQAPPSAPAGRRWRFLALAMLLTGSLGVKR